MYKSREVRKLIVVASLLGCATLPIEKAIGQDALQNAAMNTHFFDKDQAKRFSIPNPYDEDWYFLPDNEMRFVRGRGYICYDCGGGDIEIECGIHATDTRQVRTLVRRAVGAEEFNFRDKLLPLIWFTRGKKNPNGLVDLVISKRGHWFGMSIQSRVALTMSYSSGSMIDKYTPSESAPGFSSDRNIVGTHLYISIESFGQEISNPDVQSIVHNTINDAIERDFRKSGIHAYCQR